MIERHQLMLPIAPDTVLWRYISLEKFESILKTKSLFFCRQDRFADPFEGSIPLLEVESRPNVFASTDVYFGRQVDMPQINQQVQEQAEAHRREKMFTTVSCWHINNNENDAMWHLYLKDNQGVAIQTTKQVLDEVIDECGKMIYMSKVRYLNYNNEIWYHQVDFPYPYYNMLVPLIHKRIEYDYEREFRLFHQIEFNDRKPSYWQKTPWWMFWKERKTDMGLFIKMDIQKLIRNVYLAPTADHSIRRKIGDLINKYGFQFNVMSSSLGTQPYY